MGRSAGAGGQFDTTNFHPADAQLLNITAAPALVQLRKFAEELPLALSAFCCCKQKVLIVPALACLGSRTPDPCPSTVMSHA